MNSTSSEIVMNDKIAVVRCNLNETGGRGNGIMILRILKTKMNDQEITVIRNKENPIKASESAVSQMALSHDGTMVVTTSVRGTLLRGFTTDEEVKEKKILEVRRGSSQSRIYHIAFSKDDTMITCIGDKGTLHLFANTANKACKRENVGSSMRMLSFASSYVSSKWSLAQAKLKFGEATLFFEKDSNNIVFMITKNGMLFRVDFTKMLDENGTEPEIQASFMTKVYEALLKKNKIARARQLLDEGKVPIIINYGENPDSKKNVDRSVKWPFNPGTLLSCGKDMLVGQVCYELVQAKKLSKDHNFVFFIKMVNEDEEVVYKELDYQKTFSSYFEEYKSDEESLPVYSYITK